MIYTEFDTGKKEV